MNALVQLIAAIKELNSNLHHLSGVLVIEIRATGGGELYYQHNTEQGRTICRQHLMGWTDPEQVCEVSFQNIVTLIGKHTCNPEQPPSYQQARTQEDVVDAFREAFKNHRMRYPGFSTGMNWDTDKW